MNPAHRARTRVMHVTECLAAGTLQVMKALTHALHAAGAEQTIVFSVRKESPTDIAGQFPPGVRLIEVPAAHGTHVRFVRGLYHTVRQECHQWRPTHVHLHSSKAGFVGRFALRGFTSIKLLYSPHGLSFLDTRHPIRNAIFHALERAASSTHCVAVACGASEGQLLSRLSPRPAVVLENPVDDAFFTIPGDRRKGNTVVSVGRLSRQKAPERFAQLARAARERAPDLRFVWIGDGDPTDRERLERAGCEVTGWVGREDVLAWMNEADLYVQTSRWEGLPISVIQAMASGLPCVVTDAIGNRDTIVPDVSGYITESETSLLEAVMELMTDTERRRTFGMASRHSARSRFSSTVFALNVNNLYELTDHDASYPQARPPLPTHPTTARVHVS